MLSAPQLAETATGAHRTERQPVYFDVLGALVLSARAPAAVMLAALALAALALDVHLTARAARNERRCIAYLPKLYYYLLIKLKISKSKKFNIYPITILYQ